MEKDNDLKSPILEKILEAGCAVVLFEMPVAGRGSSSRLFNPNLAKMPDGSMTNLLDFPLHEAFESFPARSQGQALGLFVAPVASMTEYFSEREDPPKIGMFGLSGGGWTATLAAATVPGINFAVSVAGSDPEESFFYDYEQRHPLIADLGYTKLYALTAELGTHFVHVYNSGDPCCFRPEGKNLEAMSETVSSHISSKANGSYRVFVDGSGVGHSVRPDTQQIIIDLVSSLTE